MSSISSRPPVPPPTTQPVSGGANNQKDADALEALQVESYTRQLQQSLDQIKHLMPAGDIRARLEADGAPTSLDGDLSKEDLVKFATSLEKMLESIGDQQKQNSDTQARYRGDLRSL